MDLRRIGPGFLFTVLVLATMVFVRAADPPVISAVRGAGFDTWQRLWPRVTPEQQHVRIVDIDEASLRKLGQWPWPRRKLAVMIDRLADLGVAAIAFDILFPEPDRVSPRALINDPAFREMAIAAGASTAPDKWPDSDEVFASSMRDRPIILAFATGDAAAPVDVPVKAGFAETGASAINAPQRLNGSTHNIAVLDDAAAGIGGIPLDVADTQGVARQIPMLWSDGEKYYPSLSLEALRVAQGAGNIVIDTPAETPDTIRTISVGAFRIPVTEQGLFTLHYRADDSDLYVSAADLFESANDAALRQKLEGAIVFIGTSATGLLDTRTTALGKTIAGVSIHAQAAEQMIAGDFLERPEWVVGAEFIAVAVFGTLIAWLCAAYRPALPFAATGATAAGILAISAYAFHQKGLLLDSTFPLATLAITFLAGIAWKLLVTDQEGRKMRRVFGHYVSPSVLAEIEHNPQLLSPGGQVRDVTVMFVDIANFTPLSETLTAEELVQTVNGLWDVFGHEILKTQGTIDKFIGDAVMAFWNAPVAVPGHQREAARAALGIRRALAAYNETAVVRALMHQRKLPPIAVRIGIATGPAAVGNMGSNERFDYSVLGDTVNIASRAETACKHLGHDITIAGEVMAETRMLAILPAGATGLKGKSHAASLHIVLGDEAFAGSPTFATMREEHTYMTKQLASAKSKRNTATLKQLAAELANRHPLLASYFAALPGRAADFQG